jgi:hypothetical protein
MGQWTLPFDFGLLTGTFVMQYFFWIVFCMIYFWLQVNKKMLRAAKILERMVNQNTYDEIAQGKLAPSHICYIV